ncbi:ubiquitin fusion degradation protein 4 [Aspergillus viridinutans]|uniref:HECT-type E3 ubiquitin transferase n=1 Tax=Aspergillus viridinutans TaxID=75553 RepID=A0A9P3FAJ0_ASPVI|nr:ubiquitin fusion degradation protein 4 [Aspergillus viridinutans]GIK07061.1 ubiquitin fusion degradation protein 4 [Aspergillus viridinutans]
MARQRPRLHLQDPEDSSTGAPAIATSSSLRITRSAARLAADSPSSAGSGLSSSIPAAGSAPTRKRKAHARRDRSLDVPEETNPQSPTRRTKRQRLASPPQPATTASTSRRGTRNRPAMSQQGPSSSSPEESTKKQASPPPSRRKSSRHRGKVSQDRLSATQSPPPRRQKKRSSRTNSDVMMKEAEEELDNHERTANRESSPSNDSNDGTTPSGMDDDDADLFHNSLFGSRSPLGLQSTLRALSGMMSGMSSRLREILCNLRMKEDPSIQLIALQELSDLLLVSNEDNLSGQFSPDPYVKELVSLMQPDQFGEENPEIMLLACRCLANLMEALRGSVANVVYGGAVPILCQKLLDIQFIDLAEQALSTLAKISIDFPASIVREGGLTACLTYLDFFPTSTQRTAVTTAANCCRNLPHDAFPVVRDVMPTLLNVLSSSDQKVVEQGCLCVSRIVESFKYKPEKLEELIEPEMLRAVLRLLLPGTTNLIGPHIHTQFLRVLAITSKASPRLSVELLKMHVVDTIYQILTGVSPPENLEATGVRMDSVLVMQALIHRPREQVFETLNVICELLPEVPPGRHGSSADRMLASSIEDSSALDAKHLQGQESAEKRRSLLMECKVELKRFAMILLPTLTDAYSSTVNLGVRRGVLIAQLKMLHNLDAALIEEALRSVPYASYLAAILSQKDHPSLVSLALRCAELLFKRLEHVYRYQFHREGVISEIFKLAEDPLSTDKHSKASRDTPGTVPRDLSSDSPREPKSVASEDDGHDEGGRHAADDEDNDQDDDRDEENDDISDSESSSSFSGHYNTTRMEDATQDLVIRDARAFVELYEASEGKAMRERAQQILAELQSLAADIEDCYLGDGNGEGLPLFQELASYFDGDALESITSAELLNSGIIKVLLDVFGDLQCLLPVYIIPTAIDTVTDAFHGIASSMRDARAAFLQAFMGSTISEKAQSQSTATTPFSVLIQKLQDLLSRTEHFEVITVSHNSLENTRINATHMLGKQLRLKLVADEDSDIPRPYRNIMVSIHAIATFKSLDDFLHPRISLSDRPKASRSSDTILSQIASAARLREQLAGGGEFSSSDLPTQSRPSGGTNLTSGRDESKLRDKKSPVGHRDVASRSRQGGRHSSAPEDESEHDDEPLECADERHLSEDEEDEDEDGDEELNAIVDDLEDDLSDDNHHDPTAVNMEVASTGKVTARKEDGTRVATPSQSTPASKSSSSAANTVANTTESSSLATAGRPFASYAAAMTSIPQDWHIEFSVDDKPVSSDTTIYRAVHHNREHADAGPRNVWSAIHTVKFRRVPGPPPPEPSTITPGLEEELSSNGAEMPSSLSKDSITAPILRLLRSLHEMNVTLDDILADTKELVALRPEPLAQFINTKLTAKLNRQLEEPLIVASSCLPSWSEDLARLFPFLFPFETRHLFLQSTAFGYARAMMRWQNSQNADDSRSDHRRDDRPFLGRLQRQKVRISRSRILESAMKVMELYGSSPSVLEVEYFEEVGTGLGPTLEFYSTVSKEFSKKKLKIWRENDCHNDEEFAFGKRGLFPAPMSEEQAASEPGKKQLSLFKTLGKFVARSMLDSRIIDISFNPAFFRIADSSSSVAPSLGTVKAVDQDLANSLLLLKRFANAKRAIDRDRTLSAAAKSQALQNVEIDGVRVEDLSLDFTLPGYPSIELIDNGSNVPVTIENVDEYVDRVVDMTLGSGVQRQVEAFRTGFSQVFPYSALRTFTPNELVMLFGRAEEDWTIETLMDSIKADHGFNMDSKSVRNLLQTMSELDTQQRRDFLQFVTGSPKLPIGGFKSLTPIFTVVCRPSEPPYTPDDYLPSVMTCVNYLKLPDYSSLEVLRERLSVAIREGQGAFHLS